MGNKVALALCVLAPAVIVSACGTGSSNGPTATTQTASLAGQHRHTDPRKGCNAQGINRAQLGTGACTEAGVQYVVANYGGVVKLKHLAAGIVNVSIAPADAGHGRTARPMRDAFLRMTLQVQNRDTVPHRFSFGQTMLGIGQDDYLERVDVERNVHGESLAGVNGGMIGPGETQRGDVLFDITEGDYAQLQRAGRFFVWDFGHRASARLSRGGQVGQIRLYAGERG